MAQRAGTLTLSALSFFATALNSGPCAAQTPTPPLTQLSGVLSVTVNRQRPGQPAVYHLNSSGQDIPFFQCGKVTPEQFASQTGKTVRDRLPIRSRPH